MVFITRWSLLPDGLYHQMVLITRWSLLPDSLYYQMVFITRWSLLPDGLYHQMVLITSKALLRIFNVKCYQSIYTWPGCRVSVSSSPVVKQLWVLEWSELALVWLVITLSERSSSSENPSPHKQTIWIL